MADYQDRKAIWRMVHKAFLDLPENLGMRLLQIQEYRDAAVEYIDTKSPDALAVMAVIQHEFLHPPGR